ncbi:MAG: hypothetical protein IJ640_00800 [Prevotella sp.]|nr:hypothetical protein [Prevotella sp.]
MIGDFVAINEPDNYHGYIGKVCIINDVTGYITVFIENHDYHDVLCDDKQPIPLTPEILEKNGFKTRISYIKDKWNNEYTLMQDEDKIIYWEKGYVYLEEGETADVYLFSCQFVHELQHALKLCGIEKEIQL